MINDDLKIIDGFLNYRLVAFHIPTKYLNIDITDDLVKVKLDYKGLKLMFPKYGEEEEDNE